MGKGGGGGSKRRSGRSRSMRRSRGRGRAPEAADQRGKEARGARGGRCCLRTRQVRVSSHLPSQPCDPFQPQELPKHQSTSQCPCRKAERLDWMYAGLMGSKQAADERAEANKNNKPAQLDAQASEEKSRVSTPPPTPVQKKREPADNK